MPMFELDTLLGLQKRSLLLICFGSTCILACGFIIKLLSLPGFEERGVFKRGEGDLLPLNSD